MVKLIYLCGAVCAAAVLMMAGGCSTFDAERVRGEQTESFFESLAEMRGAILAKPLSLEDCVRVAMTNNYAARKADLDTALQKIGREVAFTAFLPNVSLSAGYSMYDKTPNPMTERRFGSASLDVGAPLFMPSSWFLYVATRHGHKAAELSANYVRQGIVLEVTRDYCQVLVLEESVSALESQLAAARESAKRIAGLADAGFFTVWERDQALLQAEMRGAELNAARRQLELARGDLLESMGLSPVILAEGDAELRLNGEVGAPARPEGAPADLVIEALCMHPMLSIADRQVVIQEHAVRQAFAAFIPVLSFGGSYSWTGNDLADHARTWMSYFGGTWSVFSGFANTARYRAAKVERRRSELERESMFLNIMSQVIAADAAARDAAEDAVIRAGAYGVAAAKYEDYDARSREGLLPLSDALDARAAMDLAQMAMVRSKFQERIALAALELAMGRFADSAKD